MSARFVTGKVLASLATLAFVIVFNFFLFRVIEGDPVANLFRGRNLTDTQRAQLTKQFGLDKSLGGQFVAYAKQINAPIRCGVEFKLVQRNAGRPGFRVEPP